MRTTYRRAVAALALGLLMTGCTTDAQTKSPATTTTSATTTITTLSSSTAVATTTGPATTTPRASSTALAEATAKEKAEEVVRAFYRAQTDCLADPAHSRPTCFDKVAIGTELTTMRNVLLAAQQMQTKVAGSIEVISATTTKVDLTDKVTATPPVVPTVTVRVCRDLSNYNIVDADGKSVVPADRKARAVDVLAVYNYKLPDATQWRVGYMTTDPAAPC